MGGINQLNIKNNTYYFYDDIINIQNFQSNLLKTDKKPYEDFDIYYIGSITIKKFDNFSDYKQKVNVKTYQKKIKIKKENMEKINIIICLKKKIKN